MRFSDSFIDQIKQASPLVDVASSYYKLRKDGARFTAIDDTSLAFTPATNLWNDFGANKRGGDVIEFIRWKENCTFEEAVMRLAERAHIAIPGARKTATKKAANGHADQAPVAAQQVHGRRQFVEITATYDYFDVDGLLLYQVCRQEWEEAGKRHKTFLQRRPAGAIAENRDDQHWIWGLNAGVYSQGRSGDYYINKDWPNAERINVEACAHVLYRWPQLREEMAQDADERRVIFICEGEKDCDTIVEWGCVATTNSGGAKNWKDYHSEELRDADVVVLMDNDKAGLERGHAIALSLRGVAKRVRALNWTDHWPDCPDHSDVTDWRDCGGGTSDKLFKIVEDLPLWSPEPPASNFDATRFIDIDKPHRLLQWTIKTILQRATLSLWYGAPSSGKSFLLTDAAMAVARGIAWMGYKTRSGLVIYQTGEGGVGFRLRLKAYRAAMHIPDNDDVPFVYLPARINLFEADADVEKLIEEIKGWKAYYDAPLELIAIDTFNAASGGANENTNQDVGLVLNRCRRLVDIFGAHVAVVHHTPAAGGRPRGHSSLVADVETTIAVEATEQIDVEERPGLSSIERTVRRWTLTKQKDGPSSIARSFVLKALKVGIDEDNDEITSCVVSNIGTATAAATKIVVPKDYVQLHPANEDLYRSLVRAIAKHGVPSPAGIESPPGRKCVTISQWQDELVERLTGHEEITPTVRNRIKMRVWRASKVWLDKLNLIGKHKEWVWRSQRKIYGIDPLPAEPEPTIRDDTSILSPGEQLEDLLNMGDRRDERQD